MRSVIDPKAQAARKKAARQGALSGGLSLALSGLVLLWARRHYGLTGLLGDLCLVLTIGQLLALLAIPKLLKSRLEEIEGGEEDAASQY